MKSGSKTLIPSLEILLAFLIKVPTRGLKIHLIAFFNSLLLLINTCQYPNFVVLLTFILYSLFLSKQLCVIIPLDSSRLHHLSQSRIDLTITKDITLISGFSFSL